MAKPWLTSDDLIEAVKRKISFPISQNTFSEADILAFANEEMFIAQVPSVLQYHEEYFVYRHATPLVTNISRYPIPNRAIGMKLRDLMWSDASSNFFEMTRINASDKAFFQRNVGANQAIHKFYLEGNDVVLTPSVVGGPTGNLNFFIFLRPNQLVANSRAATVQSFNNYITIDNSSIVNGDKVVIQTNNLNSTPTTYTFTAVSVVTNAATQFLIGASSIATATNLVALINAQVSGQAASNATGTSATVTMVGSDISLTITPSLLNNYITINSSIADGDEIIIQQNSSPSPVIYTFEAVTVVTNPTTQFLIVPGNPIATASNLVSLINAQVTGQTATNGSGTLSTITILGLSVTVSLSVSLVTPASNGIVLPNSTGFTTNNSSVVSINFDQLPSTWTDPITNQTSSLYSSGKLVDFLQTEPGHRTYVYDISIVSTSGNTAVFNRNSLLTSYSNGYNFVPMIINLKVGDYICLANESIIPQIPPDLHTVLAERTAARILAAIGDQAGLAVANQKIAEMELRQGNVLDQRVEGAPEKITARHSLLRYGKMGVRRRM